MPSEREVIESTASPATRHSLVADLRALGLSTGVGRLCAQREAAGWATADSAEQANEDSAE